MVTFPICKINLGLNIIQKRKDGFHNLETVFFPVPFHDVLEIITIPDGRTTFTNTGIQVGNEENNLCIKAFDLIKKDFPEIPAIHIHLHKVIPLGAGLGGGSADASFMLTLLNEKFQLGISPFGLFNYASELGSDCAFFLFNKPCLASSRGENMEVIPLSLSGYKILLINPGIHINTKEAFENLTPQVPLKRIKEIILQPIETWKDELKNDFERIIFPKYDIIRKIKNDLYEHNAVYASMTGTGSTVFGIFNKDEEIDYPIEEQYFHKWIAVP